MYRVNLVRIHLIPCLYLSNSIRAFIQFNPHSSNSILTSIQCSPKLIQSCGLGRAVKLTQFWGLSRFLMPSISSSVMELKRDKCSRSNKRTRRFIVQRDTLKTLAIFSQVKPIPLKSSSTSGGILLMVYLGVHSSAIDRRDK